MDKIANREALVPPQCYTKTEGKSNPCWVCHTSKNGKNEMDDWHLQVKYAFSDVGKINHWTNLFAAPVSKAIHISDQQVLGYIRQNNYLPLRLELQNRQDYPGWRPDLDFSAGFDPDGIARDGSWWRAIRYKPFLGTFWPTNGSTDDVFIRLPWQFRTDNTGRASRKIYKINLAILEAAITESDSVPDKELVRRVESIDESVAGLDLNGDGRISDNVKKIVGLPKHYVGAAKGIDVIRYQYPAGTEFLHTVRYLDPDMPDSMSTRMKEVRYAVKLHTMDHFLLSKAYAGEEFHTQQGVLSTFVGSPETGYQNDFGWQLQGFIEDARGRLRLQTKEEQYYCMGCHGTIGATVDETFSFPRKLPGSEGWRHQTLVGQKDVPESGQKKPEYMVYMERVHGGDEFRANTEMLHRYFKRGHLEEKSVLRSAPGGDRDLAWLLTPSRGRAIALDRAYIRLVRQQHFEFGRDAILSPPQNVYHEVDNVSTGLKANRKVYKDGRLWLDWAKDSP
ncbi:MAG: hypothetical protein ACRETM_13940 [Stenotrophobium sp.]